jgi:hypothetical protein
MVEPAGRPRVRFDGVAQLDRPLGGSEPADHGGGVGQVPQPGGIQRLPAAVAVEHLGQVGDQHMIMRCGVAGPGGGVAGAGPQQAPGRGAGLPAAAAAALAGEPLLQERHGGVGLGVDDGVHVIGPAHQPEHRHRLVRRHDQLHPRPTGRGEPCAAMGVTGAAGPEDRLITRVVHHADQAQPVGELAAPFQRGLAAAAVVGQRGTGVVVAAVHHRVAVVVDLVGAHPAEPGHGRSRDTQPGRVAIVFSDESVIRPPLRAGRGLRRGRSVAARSGQSSLVASGSGPCGACLVARASRLSTRCGHDSAAWSPKKSGGAVRRTAGWVALVRRRIRKEDPRGHHNP